MINCKWCVNPNPARAMWWNGTWAPAVALCRDCGAIASGEGWSKMKGGA